MLNCYLSNQVSTQSIITPIILVSPSAYPQWLSSQATVIKNWLQATQYRSEAGQVSLIPDSNGKLSHVLCTVNDVFNLWDVGHLPLLLPQGVYQFVMISHAEHLTDFAVAFGLGAYQFTRYKKALREPATLVLAPSIIQAISPIVDAIYLVRDLINTPTDDMGPTQFAAAASKMAKTFGAHLTQFIGDELLENNYASIYTVGRASDDAPRLLDIRFGDQAHPKITLVGKGVCFDSGGLDIKSASNMQLMKKDMAGAAHALGLAQMIMALKLPVCLRVLIPVVENVISGNAYRPGDIIKSRQGLTIEVGNTDAEGRLILADALAEAVSEKPALLIDLSTLTGAARVAVGTDLSAVFSNQAALVHEVIKHGEKKLDPIWHLPLYAPYREYINSSIADINNNSNEPYAGAITAALFLKEFVPDDIAWMHFDMMAWNIRTRPGRPQGGEAMALRALISYLRERFQ